MNVLPAGSSQTQTLPPYQALTISGSAGSGSLVRLGDVPGEDMQGVTPVAAGKTIVVGPFTKPTRYNVICDVGSLSFGIAAATAAAMERKQQVVATRGAIHGGVANSGTTMTRGEHRMKVNFGPSPCRDIQLVFGNFQASGSAAEVAGPNAITVEAAIETISPSVAFATVTFGGDTSVVIQPGAVVISDPIPLDFDANASAWIRTGVIVTLGQSWPRTSMFAITGEAMYESTEATSQVQATGAMAARATGAVAGGGYIPMAIIGVPMEPFPSVGLLGDSIMAGTVGDSSDATTGARGMFARGMYFTDGTVWPWGLLARASETAAFNVGVAGYRRRGVMDYCTHIICDYGTNDIAASATLAAIQASLTTIWTSAKRRGCKVYQSLILPRTNAGNTAPSAGFTVGGVRDQLNAWIITQVGNGILDGYIDTNAIAESKVTPGLWANSAWTSDGTHPNAAGCIAIAAAVRSVAAAFTV
ncbi:SGNH/GDSL hydrolase family protein [Phyllobacterium chamaecytisi]|uniref:SGNH/GDSL hydrolase family protein n=1 Tax=Phyllobacterium chamaecytisi TaxID=2876082 RepID=UPI001CCABF0D|nr:SGNH/GDSL hydrolase family protein [Phyllobacterium sp. KW56]MBZ9600746.1 SGNH/GDSL hydrolase family protein [Phyllobacterium sp. KW56]